MRRRTETVLETEHLTVKLPEPARAADFMRIWSDPAIMSNVGFPQGLTGLNLQSMEEDIRKSDREGRLFDRPLAVHIKKTSCFAGECVVGMPGKDLVSKTDIKLLREYQGAGYGSELKSALVNYIFSNTKARAVSAGPNRSNTASIRMQEKCGGVRIAACRYEPSERMRALHGAESVDYYLYMIYKNKAREDQGVIFDLDGTLLNTIEDISTSINRVLERNGFKGHGTEDYRNMVGSGMRMTVKRALPAGTDEKTVDLISAESSAEYLANCTNNTNVYPGMKRIVKRLKDEGFFLGVLTNKPHEAAVSSVEHYFGEDMFHLIRGVKDDGMRKPHAPLVCHVRDISAIPGEKIKFVGDSSVDRETAAAGGMEFIPVEWGYGYHSDRRQAADADMLYSMIKSH